MEKHIFKKARKPREHNLKTIVLLEQRPRHHFAHNYGYSWLHLNPPNRFMVFREKEERGRRRAGGRMTAWGFFGSILVSLSSWGSQGAAVGTRGQDYFDCCLSIFLAASWLQAVVAWRLGSMPCCSCVRTCVSRGPPGAPLLSGGGVPRMRSPCIWKGRV